MKTILKFLESFEWIEGALVSILAFTILVIIGIFLSRRYANHQHLRAHHDVAGFVFANLGVLFSVLLGFTVVNVQQRYDKIKEHIEVEASYLGELFRDSEVFDPKSRSEIQDSIKNYLKDVIREEWCAEEGRIGSQSTDSLKQIWNAYYTLEPSGTKQEAWYTQSISTLNSLMHARLSRILGSEESLGVEMWTLLICGGIIVVLFICLFSFESSMLHILMGVTLATTTAFLLFLIYSLDTAYCGSVQVGTEAFNRVLQSIQ